MRKILPFPPRQNVPKTKEHAVSRYRNPFMNEGRKLPPIVLFFRGRFESNIFCLRGWFSWLWRKQTMVTFRKINQKKTF